MISFRASIKFIPAFGALVICIANVALSFIQMIDADNWTNYVNVMNFSLALIASFTVLYTALFSSKELESRRTYWGLFIAFTSYLIAESIWTFVPIFTGNPDLPYPSFADLFWVLGTITLISEVILHGNELEEEVNRKSMIILFLIIGAIIIALVVIAFWEVIVEEFDPVAGYGPIQKALDIFYFTGDCLIVYAVGIVGLKHLKTPDDIRDDIGWFLLLLGMIAMVIGDTIFTYPTDILINGTPNYLLENVLYTFQYVFWIFGATMFPMKAMEKKNKGGN